MINALRAETRRLVSRRFTLVALIALLALVALFQLQVNSEVSPPSASERAELQQEYDEYVRDWEANHEEWQADCQEAGGTAGECAEPRPQLSDWGLGPLAFDEAVGPAISFAIYLDGLVLFVAMASFIGAETSSGSLANWLTFVPRRGVVLVSKLVVVAAFSLVVGALLGFVTLGLSTVIAGIHQQPLVGFDDLLAMAARGALVVAVFGIAGFAIGLMTGSTGASIAILLGGLFVSYVLVILAFTARWAEHLAPWNPATNLDAILQGGTTYEVSAGPGSPMDEDYTGVVTRTLSLAHGLGYWAVAVTALVALSWLLFRRRDLT